MGKTKDNQLSFNASRPVANDRRRRVEEILDRGVVVKSLPSQQAVIDRLASEQPARIYIGADPTGPELHLSHAKNYMLLEEFRQLGHKVIVLFGDFTARIGDPTDRSSSRARLSAEQVAANIEKWKQQIAPIIDFDHPENPAEIALNSAWLGKLSAQDLVELTSQMTVQRMLERNMFQQRLDQQQPIHIHEFLYPLFQGYDSVALDVDIELCGTDQEFNALVGRNLQAQRNREKMVVEVNLMENPNSGELMSKSTGQGVFLSAGPEDLYGQVMALPDEMTEVCFINVTRRPKQEIAEIIAGHPREAKAQLARDLVTTFHGLEAAEQASQAFNRKFVNKDFPADAPRYQAPNRQLSAIDLAVLGGQEKYGSKSAVRRVIADGGMRVNGQVITDIEQIVDIDSGAEVRLGKRLWFKVQ